MNIVIIGDQHKDIKNLKNILTYCYNNDLADVFIQVGDLGLTDNFDAFLDELNWELKVQVKDFYFIDGNHDNQAYLRSKIVEPFQPVAIRSHIYYIPRGSLLKFGNKTFFCIGGGYSINHRSLKEGKSYWKEETITKSDIDFIKSYYNNSITADYIISHDTTNYFDKKLSKIPKFIYKILHKNDIKHKDNLTNLFNIISAKIIIHGHYHKRLIQQKNNKTNISLGQNGQPIKDQILQIKA